MKIRLFSDVHLEHSAFEVPKVSGESEMVLVLAGDINPVRNIDNTPIGGQSTSDFFKSLENRFKAVLFISGNHEYYHGEVNECDLKLKKLQSRFEDFFFLQNGESLSIDGVNFIGATLWTSFSNGNYRVYEDAAAYLNDFRCISIKKEIENEIIHKPFMPDDAHEIHKVHLANLLKNIKKGGKNVVITHHAPHPGSVAEKYIGTQISFLNPCYYSDLEKEILTHEPYLWLHGHTHTFFDYNVGKTRVVCSPRGYAPHEETGYNDKLILEV